MTDKKKYIKQYLKQWRKDNPEKMKQYTKNNIENVKEYNKQYYKDNPEKAKRWQKDNREHSKEYYKNNEEKIKEQTRQWQKNNPEEHNEYQKRWAKNNREKINGYLRNKRKTDLKYNINRRMGTAIRVSLKNNKAGRHWETLVGYTLKDLIKRLEKTLPEGYTWDNYLDGKLHIDHIIPKSIFHFTKSEHIDFQRCWALNNLQLLPAKENLIKGNELSKPFQLALQI